MQIIVLALLLGVIGFAAFCIVSGPLDHDPQAIHDSLPIVSITAAAMFVTNLVLSFILPGIIAQGALTTLLRESSGETDAAEDGGEMQTRLLNSYQTGLIVAIGLLEFAAFMATVGYLIDGQLWVLGIVVAAVLLICIRFPGEMRLRAWLDQQRERLRGLRQETQLRRS
jgi:hypothetical protein